MKLAVSLIGIALASSALAAAAPQSPQPAEIAAPAADRIGLARRFIAMTNPAEEMMSNIRDASVQAAALTGEDELSAADQARAQHRIDRILARAEPVIHQKMPAVLEAYAQAYAREFTADELLQLMVFAQTPAGRHYVAKSELLNLDADVLKAHQELNDEMQPIMEEVTREMCAEKAAQRIAAGDIKAKCPLSGEAETASG
jgi:hypothetical protein